jgi:hypothetical protein
MTPNITKGQTDTSKFVGEAPKGTGSDPTKNPVTEYNPAGQKVRSLRPCPSPSLPDEDLD